MADVSGLTQSISQVTGQVFQNMREERARELRQEQINSTNSIIRKALDFDAKLSTNNVTPFVRQKKVFEYVADEERKAGLPTGSALGSYKQFFGLGASGSVGTKEGDISKWIKIKSGEWGEIRANPNNTTETITILVPQEAMAYDDLYNKNKAMSDDLWKTFSDGGMVEKYGIGTVTDWSNNVQLAMQNPEAAALVNGVRRRSQLKDQLTEAETYGKLKVENVKKFLREGKIGVKLTEFTKSLIDTFEHDPNLTLPEAKARLANQVKEWSQDSPKEFKEIYGDLLDQLDTYITNAHPSTQFDATTHNVKSRKEYIEHQNNIIYALGERAILDNPGARNVALQVNLLKGVDPALLGKIKIGSGINGKDALRMLSATMDALGDEGYQETLDTIKFNQTKALMPTKQESTPEGEQPKEYKIDEDPTSQHILGIMSQVFKPQKDQTGASVMHNIATLDVIRKDKKVKENVLNTLDNMLGELVPLSENDPVVKRIIMFKTMIEED